MKNLSSKKVLLSEKKHSPVSLAFSTRERALDEGFYTVSRDRGDSPFFYQDLNDLVKSIFNFIESHPIKDPCPESGMTPDEISFFFILDVLGSEGIIDDQQLFNILDVRDLIDDVLDIIEFHSTRSKQIRQNNQGVHQSDQVKNLNNLPDEKINLIRSARSSVVSGSDRIRSGPIGSLGRSPLIKQGKPLGSGKG